ncbi:MAG TPA: FAD-dependent oxidoreductase [Thermoanaerobaculia bacterium]|nr:FAD-dependent oxidoreductase [Thermoanaerobaculia bacterium]
MAYSATVTEIEHLAPEVVQLTVSIHQEGLVFKPGQWVNFHFPEGVSRAYTIASAPERPQAVQLCIRRGGGKGGSALEKLEAGASVRLDGPHGDFVVPENDTRCVVFLAGDTGIAPVRSIVLHLLATNDPRPIIVLYEPDRRHILYAADFDPLARSGRIIHESGAIEMLIERNRSHCTGGVVMAVGFDPFLDRVSAALRHIGIDTASIISESFGPQP